MSIEINAPATLTTPGGVISFNPTTPTTDYYFITSIPGLAQAPLRTSRSPKPQAPGSIQHASERGERLITVSGVVVASSFASRTSMCRALLAAVESIENVDGTWAWTETGGSYSVTVRSDIECDFVNGDQGPAGPKKFTFGLVAADPAIS